MASAWSSSPAMTPAIGSPPARSTISAMQSGTSSGGSSTTTGGPSSFLLSSGSSSFLCYGPIAVSMSPPMPPPFTSGSWFPSSTGPIAVPASMGSSIFMPSHMPSPSSTFAPLQGLPSSTVTQGSSASIAHTSNVTPTVIQIPSLYIAQTSNATSSSSSSGSGSSSMMRLDYLEGFEKFEERKRGLFQRAHNLHGKAAGIFTNLLRTFILFTIVGSGRLFVGLTCDNAKVIGCENCVLLIFVVGLAYGEARWRLNLMSLDEENLDFEDRRLIQEVNNYLDSPDKLANDGYDKIRVPLPSNWTDRCAAVREDLRNKHFIDYHMRWIRNMALIGFAAGLLVLVLICVIHCFGT